MIAALAPFVAGAILVLLLAAFVWLNVDYRRRLKRMTPEERAAHEAEVDEDKPW